MVLDIVNEANLESCTVKSILEALEARLHCSLGDHTQEVKAMIDDILIERLTAEEDARLARQIHEEELKSTRRRAIRARIPVTKPAPRDKRVAASGFNRPLILSTALSDLLGGVQLVISLVHSLKFEAPAAHGGEEDLGIRPGAWSAGQQKQAGLYL